MRSALFLKVSDLDADLFGQLWTVWINRAEWSHQILDFAFI
jgi:hypothetical protein